MALPRKGDSPLMDEHVERYRVEEVFGLGGITFSEDEWPGVSQHWFEGIPCWMGASYPGIGDPHVSGRRLRTAVSYTSMWDTPEAPGWKLLTTISTSGEAVCCWCGEGTEWDGSEEQMIAREQEPLTPTGYRGDPTCPLCDGDGTIYLGWEWRLAVYEQDKDQSWYCSRCEKELDEYEHENTQTGMCRQCEYEGGAGLL